MKKIKKLNEKELIERIREILTAPIKHHEFCLNTGEQYKECALCYIERKLKEIQKILDDELK